MAGITHKVRPDYRPSRPLQWHTCAEWLREDPLVYAAYRAGLTEEEFIKLLMEEKLRLQADLVKCLSNSPITVPRAAVSARAGGD